MTKVRVTRPNEKPEPEPTPGALLQRRSNKDPYLVAAAVGDIKTGSLVLVDLRLGMACGLDQKNRSMFDSLPEGATVELEV